MDTFAYASIIGVYFLTILREAFGARQQLRGRIDRTRRISDIYRGGSVVRRRDFSRRMGLARRSPADKQRDRKV